MRSRLLAVVLGVILALGLVACGTNNQAAQAPPADSTQPAQAPAAQAAQPGQAPAARAPQAGPAAPAQSAQAEPARPAAAPPTPAPEPPPPPKPIVIPAGIDVVVAMSGSISSKDATAGQTFLGTLANAIAVDGRIVVPAGAGVTGTVTEAKSAGKFKGEGIIAVRLVSINVNGVPHSVGTDEYVLTAKGKGKRTAGAVAGGTGAGALIGGIAGGGKGAAIGALVGAGVGAAGAGGTGNKELTIASGSPVTFRTTSSITIQP